MLGDKYTDGEYIWWNFILVNWLVILYTIHYHAVKDGINKSFVGKLIKRKYHNIVAEFWSKDDLDRD